MVGVVVHPAVPITTNIDAITKIKRGMIGSGYPNVGFLTADLTATGIPGLGENRVHVVHRLTFGPVIDVCVPVRRDRDLRVPKYLFGFDEASTRPPAHTRREGYREQLRHTT